MKLDTLENEIAMILNEEERTRADDMTLYFEYLIRHEVTILRVFSDRKYRIMHGISSFESVSRCRRKLQTKYDDLRPDKKTINLRHEEEKKFKEYARRKKC